MRFSVLINLIAKRCIIHTTEGHIGRIPHEVCTPKVDLFDLQCAQVYEQVCQLDVAMKNTPITANANGINKLPHNVLCAP